jgi:hypothetical protein
MGLKQPFHLLANLAMRVQLPAGGQDQLPRHHPVPVKHMKLRNMPGGNVHSGNRRNAGVVFPPVVRQRPERDHVGRVRSRRVLDFREDQRPRYIDRRGTDRNANPKPGLQDLCPAPGFRRHQGFGGQVGGQALGNPERKHSLLF